ncbi:class II glutamine amidotransferase [Actinoallomurus spadix]|uniref:Class II glutamine amidotransferase n=1 Tax=Actinoallomurus spadix TaxID=79912 RepID=A0ABP3HG04_9ACTN|nr:class II glutamine amidotransferase [Actinoallomurus spadix]MCO5988456.1 class II glutamine amidotransferase [Actinoallomurus spadix]
MCRLLGLVSRSPGRLNETLGDLLSQFTELSSEHADGWGVATWQNGGLVTAKGTTPARTSREYAEAAQAVTDAAVMHIRMASPNLSVELGNTHPFRLGALAFAHNGFFTPPDALDELVDPLLLAKAAGTTDSERYFLRIVSLMQDQDPVTAMAIAAAEIRGRAEFASLNCLLITEDSLYAYAEEDPQSEVSRRRGPEFFRMRYLVESDRIVVASTGFADVSPEGERWLPLPYRQVLQVRRRDLRVSVHRFPGAIGARQGATREAMTEAQVVS